MNTVRTSVSALFLAVCVLSAQETREIKKTVALAKDGQVTIDTYKGSVKVETWDKAEVDIVATIEADGWDRYAEEKVGDTEVRIREVPGSVRITTDYDRVKKHSSGFFDWFDGNTGNLPFVHYSVRIPSTARLKIKDYKSEIDVRNLHADLDLNTYKGSVEISGMNGGVELETYKGTCRVEFASFASPSSFGTSKGEINLVLPKSASFDLDAELGRKGDFDSDFTTVTSSRSRRRAEYSGPVNGGGPALRLRTDKGEFRLVSR